MISSVSAGGIVFRRAPKGVRWLICKNASYLGWIFPKGQVGDHIKDETIPEAALREVQEESGVKAKIVGMLVPPVEYFYSGDNGQVHKTVHYFLMEYIAGNTKKHDKEILEAKFVDSATAMSMLTFDNDRIVFQNALQQLNQLKN